MTWPSRRFLVALEMTPRQLRKTTLPEYVTQLRQILVEYFDEGELKTLCFDLGIDYESLPGAGKANKARDLVAYVQRHGRLQELILKGKVERPWRCT